MKLLLERSIFMLIGALIASIAYFIGNADRSAVAQDGFTRFDKIECSELMVNGKSQDGISGFLYLHSKDDKPALELRRGENSGYMLLKVDEAGAGILLNEFSNHKQR